MKVITTTRVFSHEVNQEYPCILVIFEPEDSNFFVAFKGHPPPNWIPRHREVIEILTALLDADPDFGEDIREVLDGR